ncbi:MAG: hypothetical protein CSA58_05430 [Micrococcales bacterium]|nr:MAG: hypothetical protein CSB46_02140 [Micrococcales bacterium]PIE27226.1 MAG: hypothetical protein CSA58_05430 [Micrococcales bacterium]
MNTRLVTVIALILGGPSIYTMLQGRLDPDAAMIRIMGAVAFGVFTDLAVRGYVSLAGPGATDQQADPEPAGPTPTPEDAPSPATGPPATDGQS